MPVLGGFASTYDRGLRLVVVPVVGLAQQPTKVPVCMEFLGTLVGFGSRFLCDPAVIAGGAPEHGRTQELVLKDADRLTAGRTDDPGSGWVCGHLGWQSRPARRQCGMTQIKERDDLQPTRARRPAPRRCHRPDRDWRFRVSGPDARVRRAVSSGSGLRSRRSDGRAPRRRR